MRMITYKEIKTQTWDQGCANGIERMLLHRHNTTLLLVDLDCHKNESAETEREKPPEDLP